MKRLHLLLAGTTFLALAACNQGAGNASTDNLAADNAATPASENAVAPEANTTDGSKPAGDASANEAAVAPGDKPVDAGVSETTDPAGEKPTE